MFAALDIRKNPQDVSNSLFAEGAGVYSVSQLSSAF